MVATHSYDHIYVSPHLDDVVLSCGGRIWRQTQMGERVLVVTVFAGGPRPELRLSPFARQLHARWEESGDAAAARRLEDLQAMTTLGAQAVHWPYTDCIYRQISSGEYPYASEESLWGPIHPEEEALVAEIRERLTSLPHLQWSAVYAPLGAGNHVDHQIVRQAVENLGRVLFYEDYPYAEDEGTVRSKLNPGDWRADIHWLSEHALEAKASAIACYRSQLSTFWTSIGEMRSAIRRYAEQVGQSAPAERYWRPI
ncbi:MAG: PIG-L family deacetylase [Chloroflexi bacterium]|nr:PIG-L family deacetylase [Chloroflexota bacterium]